jgi:hypothetical protein
MTIKERLDILFKPDFLCTLEEMLIKQEYEGWKKKMFLEV